MNDVTLIIKQYVSIMSILHIEEITEKRIPSQTFNKVLLTFFKIVVKVFLKEISKGPLFVSWKLLLNSIQRACVFNAFYESRVIRSDYYFVWP